MTKKTALMSIQPHYWSRIADGTKLYELRRSRVRLQPGDEVIVYSSSPTKAIVGSFLVSSIVRGQTDRVWRSLRPELGVTRREYAAYFDGADEATAIGLSEVHIFEKPISLDRARRRIPNFRPPQSYMYWPQVPALVRRVLA